ncbi:acyltransferase domain-containing protein [Nocardia wallacei]|uniref:acyltransferase domain-containing protein n=1 Tax=Nocardia wallacei TaxID=480035 RepID=UPI002456FDC4|nr:acyltransferase domain-containing protein [Nocardia wallacei]
MSRTVYLIPGQGGDPRGALRPLYAADAAIAARIDAVLDRIESTASGSAAGLRDALLGAQPARLPAAGLPQLAAYAVSVVLADVLAAAGITADAIVGQSFGEIAALVCAGVFDVEDGTRAVCALNAAFSGFEGRGGMVLVAASEEETRVLLAGSGHPDLVLACVNTPHQTIVSGPSDAIEALFAHAAQGPRLIRLAVPYASHHPGLTVVAERFRAGLHGIPQRPLRVPVHSPVRRRSYSDGDDLHEGLVDCVVEPVYLPETLIRVAAGGPVRFVEVGVGDTLCRCARATVPHAATLAPLDRDLPWIVDIAATGVKR